jgi:hypothetical protein
MKSFLAIFGTLLGCGTFLIGRSSVTVPPCESRYELRDTGIVGLTIRLDKQTGETKIIPTIPAISGVALPNHTVDQFLDFQPEIPPAKKP